MRWTGSEQAAAEARKAEGASCTALLTPIHRECGLGPGSVILAEIDVNNYITIDFSNLSYSSSIGENKVKFGVWFGTRQHILTEVDTNNY